MNGRSHPRAPFVRPAVETLTPYQPGRPVEDVQRELGLERVVKLASNEGPFPPFPAALEAMAAGARELNRYPDGGIYRLHEALAARHGVAFEEVCAGAGADGCIDMLSQAALDPGDEIVCGWPSFPSYAIYAHKQGADVRAVPLRELRYDLDGLLDAIGPRTKLVYVCHPNNPTGTASTEEELDTFFDRVPDDVLVVVDQAYFEYASGPGYPDAVERYVKAGRRVLVLRTFSKIYGLAGLRVGYAVGPREVCAAMAKTRRPFDLTAPAQGAALASLDDRAELDRRRALNVTGLERLAAVMRKNGFDPASEPAGNFLYAEVGEDAPQLCDRLLREGVIVRPLGGFGAPDAIRVSVGAPDEIEFFATALERVLARRNFALRSLGIEAFASAVRLQGARTVFADVRFRLLFFATLGSGLGNWLAVIALQVDVYDRTHSGWWVAALLIANILPAVFVGLMLGPLVDRLSRKGLMIASDLGRLAVFAALPFVNSTTAIVVLAAVAGVGTAFFRPAVLAGVPNLVADDDLPIANALLQLVEWATIAIGPLLGGALTAISGPDLAYWVNAVTFGISAALVAFIPGHLLQSDRRIGAGHWHDLKAGFHVLRTSRPLLTVLVAWSIAMVASALINVAEVFLAKDAYGAGDFGFGLLWAGSGVGLVLGGLAAGSLLAGNLGAVYVRLLVVFAAGIAAAAIAPNIWLGVLAMVVGGFGNGGAVVANITFVQRGADDNMRGRAFTVLMSVNYAVLGVALVCAGPITDAIGARWVYAIAAGTILIAAGTAWRLLRGVERAAGVAEAA